MKKIVLSLVATTAMILASDKAYVGAGPYIQTQPYIGESLKVLPSPFVLFDNGQFYGRWMQFGAYFLGEQSDSLSWGLSATIEPNANGYKSGDSDILIGMQDRKSSFNGGLNFVAKNEYAFFDATYAYDMLSNHKGGYARAQIGSSFVSGDWSVTPSLLMSWYDSNFNSYYYGVKSDEVGVNRAYYEVGSSYSYGAQVYVMYDIDTNWHALLNVKGDLLDTKIKESPIVDDSNIYSGTITLLYSF
jgi:MipA family protein